MKKTSAFFVIAFLLWSIAPQNVAQESTPLEISEADLLEELMVSEDDLILENDEPFDAPKSINEDPALLKDDAVFFNEPEPEPAEEWIDDAGDLDLIDDVDVEKLAPDLEPPRAPKGNKGSRIDVSAYEDVLNENMAIRKAADAYADENVELKQEIAGYKNTIREQERQLTESVELIQTLKKNAEASGNAPKVAARVDPASDDSLLKAANARISDLQDQISTLSNEIVALKGFRDAQAPKAPAEGPQEGSALYKSMEQELFKAREDIKALEKERATLTDALATAEAEMDGLKAFKDSADQRELALRKQVEEALAGQQQYKTTIGKLIEHVPDLQEEVSEYKNALEVKDDTIRAKDHELMTLRQELERRELRIIKSERMAELLEQTGVEVRKASETEKRDMHFNMAVVYTKEGNYRAAEKEYLHSLRIDPTDASAHYNLAILYDDHIGDARRAARHYRAYLKLAPMADDVDEVKSWLIALEMQ